MRIVIATLLLSLTACTQPAPAPAPPEAAAPEAADAALLAALTPIASAGIGQDVSLQTSNVRVQDDWAWLVAQPRQADGAAINWATTALASRYEHGAMDESGAIYALLKNESGAWRVVAHTIAPTDVAWLNWETEYGAPAGLIDAPAPPTP